MAFHQAVGGILFLGIPVFVLGDFDPSDVIISEKDSILRIIFVEEMMIQWERNALFFFAGFGQCQVD